MKISYVRTISVFFLSLTLFVFNIPASAHNNPSSHNVFKGMGDGYRAVMSKRKGMGGSVFTLYVELNAVIANGTSESASKNLVTKLGTAFIPYCKGCDGRFLLTNRHVADINKVKKEYDEKIHDLLNFPPEVTLDVKETYKAVDSSGVTFLVSLMSISDSIDAALFRFDTEPNPPRKSFILQDENEISFSPVGVLGSPLEISNMLGTGNIARVKTHECTGDEKQEYLVITAPLNPGNSGGPIYNFESDKVNGMATLYLTSNGGNSLISCGVPASLLIKFLDENLSPRK
jgi:S1-C subfamily serine protease